MASTPWVILGSVPRVCDDDELQQLSLDLAPPPRVSIVTVPWRVAPDPTTGANFPAFRAADPSAGLLLLVTTQGTLAAAGRTMGDDSSGHPTHVDHDVMLPAYFVCDLASATASRLPEPDVPVSYHRNQALTATPGGHYMVAHLGHIDDAAADHATLLCFWSDTNEWVEKTLPLLHDGPLPRKFGPSDCAITHDSRLWWVDLSRGILTCDPFADQPQMRFLPFPPGKSLPPPKRIDKYRCVKVSAGKLRFLDIDRRADKVTMWTLQANQQEWVLEHQLSFQHLRADDSYKAAGLEEDSDPVLAFVHPTNPDVVYFFLEENLVAVDMRAIKVVDCDVCLLVLPPMKFVSSGFVIACELPPSISTDHIVEPEFT
ncbi:hypothetical protein EJB05_43461, partial [Eragrostis curvula]